MDNAFDQSTVDYLAISRLQATYADIVTRRAWAELHDIFRPDIVIEVDRRVGDPLRIVGPDELGRFVGTSLEDFSFFEFVILNSVIDVGTGGDPNVATSRFYMNELRLERADGRFTKVYGLYQDRYRRVDGRWWFDRRWYGTLARTSAPGSAAALDTFPFPATPDWTVR